METVGLFSRRIHDKRLIPSHTNGIFSFENIKNIISIKLQGEMIARIRPDRRLTEKITFEDIT